MACAGVKEKGAAGSRAPSDITALETRAESRTEAESATLKNQTSEEAELIESLEKVSDHITGSSTRLSTELAELKTIIVDLAESFGSSTQGTAIGFDLVDAYDAKHGAMFTNGSKTDDGFSRSANGYELEHVILAVMQGIFDHAYTESNLLQNSTLFKNRKFLSSSYFPGRASAPADDKASPSVKINATHMRGYGLPALYEEEDARRPTGCYLAPGSVATVTVPPSLVGIGASVLVGAHTWDLGEKKRIERMHRVSKKYEITDTSVNIGNPLGGQIYINVPFEIDLGILDITISNVIRSPYFANTAANQTTAEQWKRVERHRNAPWADFESNKVMFQVPSSWIYAMDDPTAVMKDWDLAVDAVSELFSRPKLRPKTTVYAQVDVLFRGGANFPGYPQSNTEYDPDLDYGGNHDHHFTKGPRANTDAAASTFFHELGHAESFHKFEGETEAVVNFLWVAVQNKKFGVDINEAFNTARGNLKHTIEEAAQSWMISENFRMGNPMSKTTGQFRQEFAYQPRGFGKYADIARLFGWEALEQFYENLNIAHEEGVRYDHHVSQVPWDDMSLRMSIGAGVDLTPLFHFWGIHPVDQEGLRASIAANSLKASAAIYDQLMAYKAIVPQDNAAFRAFGLEDFEEDKIVNYETPFDHRPMSYYEGFLNSWWYEYDNSHARAAEEQVQAIIDLYFPNGRPE